MGSIPELEDVSEEDVGSEEDSEPSVGCFLDTYLGTVSDTIALPERISKLVDAWSVRDAAVPLDMLATYCHRRLSAARAASLVVVETDGVRVRPENGDDFVGMLFEHDALWDWPRCYAGGGLDESAGKRRRLAGDG